MSKWKKLIDSPDAWIRRGSVLRVPLKTPNDSNWYSDAFTDLIVFDPREGNVYGLLVASGHKSGMIRIVFPPESSENGVVGLKKFWLLENWKKWVYPNGAPEDVWIRDPEQVDWSSFGVK